MRFSRLPVNDSAGQCRSCGNSLDDGGCDCKRCDDCGRLIEDCACARCLECTARLPEPTESDCCVVCESRWLAAHQLTSSALDRNQISQGAAASGAEHFLPAPVLAEITPSHRLLNVGLQGNQARESTTEKPLTDLQGSGSRGGQTLLQKSDDEVVGLVAVWAKLRQHFEQ